MFAQDGCSLKLKVSETSKLYNTSHCNDLSSHSFSTKMLEVLKPRVRNKRLYATGISGLFFFFFVDHSEVKFVCVRIPHVST